MAKFSQYLLTIYREKIKVHRGKIYDYLGTDLDSSETGVVKFLMVKYLKKVVDEFP